MQTKPNAHSGEHGQTRPQPHPHPQNPHTHAHKHPHMHAHMHTSTRPHMHTLTVAWQNKNAAPKYARNCGGSDESQPNFVAAARARFRGAGGWGRRGGHTVWPEAYPKNTRGTLSQLRQVCESRQNGPDRSQQGLRL